MLSGSTIRDFLRALCPEIARSRKVPIWPPDAFGLSAALLQESGAYLEAFREWPPLGSTTAGCLDVGHREWCARIREIGQSWKVLWEKQKAPAEVQAWWTVVRDHDQLPLRDIRVERSVGCALLQICAAADEAYGAAWGAGQVARDDPFRLQAQLLLLPDRRTGSSLGHQVKREQLRILPKYHTPQTGMSLRSMSHHLALWTGSDVTPLWFTAKLFPRLRERSVSADQDIHSLSLLLVPWPTEVTPRQFMPAVPPHGRLLNMSGEDFGFFLYRREPDPDGMLERLERIYEAARRLTPHIDGVVLPELALEDSEYQKISRWVTGRNSFLIAGVGSAGENGGPDGNRVVIEFPTGEIGSEGVGHRIRSFQTKHHRWCLDRNQIIQYGLGGQLNPEKRWWEHVAAEARNLTFVGLHPWLSLCALVCEDLARQDPVAHLVRAVGPNLVISLLMDGPQIGARWPARYATVLADDPGSSVLTFTSIGMCEFSRPPGKPPSRAIALWKDAYSGEAVQIDLPPRADAVLLNLVRRMSEEWTADGRSDGKTAGYPALAGIHPVFCT